jgi:hypothetical protein
MTGPEHYRRAEELAAEAHRLLGQGTARPLRRVGRRCPGPAVLALAAATAVGASGADHRLGRRRRDRFGSGRSDH